jgi:hypothetical protein
MTLADVVRAPTATLPEVVVLDEMHETEVKEETLDPKEDLWLSSADG